MKKLPIIELKTAVFCVLLLMNISLSQINAENFLINTDKRNKIQDAPLRLGVVGFSHDHIAWLLGRKDFGDIEIVGIAEPNEELVERYAEKYDLEFKNVYASLEEMVLSVNPEAVAAFNPINEHIKVVEYCAPKGIHVMVEKPLATSVADAERMIGLAEEYGIELITNYETTWYESTWEAYNLINEKNFVGELRKIVFHTGHRGPVALNPEKYFFSIFSP